MAEGDDRLEVLLELTRRLSTDGPLEELLQATTDAALRLLPADHASIRLLDDERLKLLASARSGAGREQRPIAFSRGQGVIGVVADTGRRAIVRDVERDDRFSRRATGFPIGSIVAVPLRAGGSVVGVLSMSAAEIDAFDEDDCDLAQLLANCTAPAIETARLARLSVTDDLTRAFNHRYHVNRLAEEVGRARRYDQRFSLLMLDLDHFKQVNDGWGHLVGDYVLQGFVERVRAEVRESDVLIRRGGEEFALLMPATLEDEALQVAERIRARVASAPIAADWAEVPLTVSIGVATWEHDESPADLEGRADAALYRAKEAGRDRVLVAAPDEPRRSRAL